MALFIDGKQVLGSLVVEGDLTMPLPTYKTSSGSVATFETDMTENLVEVKCQIVAKQASGTPSPVNPLPIQTYDSLTLYHNDINMWDEQWKVYGSGATARIGSKNPIPCVGGRTYYLTSKPAYGWKFYDIEGNVVLTYYNKTCTAPSNAVYMMFQLDDTYGTVYNHDVSLNYPATDTDYHAFNGAYIPFGQTVAKGTLNVTTGKLVITNVKKKVSDFFWNKNVQNTDGDGRIWYHSFLNDTTYNGYAGALCDAFDYQDSPNWANLHLHKYFSINQYFIICVEDNYATSNDLIAVYGDVEFTVILKTPQEIQLDSTQITALLNENNIWCDTGDTTAKYILSVGEALRQG